MTKGVACFGALLWAACNGSLTPEQTCLETAEVAAKAGERCGFNKAATQANFIREAAGGSCANVTSIRDEAALRNQCFPWLKSTSCYNLYGSDSYQMTQTFDPSCNHQLIRGSNEAGTD